MSIPLTDLLPSHLVDESGRRVGVSFVCPVCFRHRVAVLTDPPFDPPFDDLPELLPWGKLWKRTGDTFETLTLQPSIDDTKGGCWHGFVTNGEVTP